MKVLIIKFGALGDIIVSTSVIKQIQDAHIKDETFLLTTPAFTDLFSCFENLNITAYDRKGIKSFFKTLSWMREQKFDRIYDLQSSDRSAIYCALSGAKLRAGNHPRYPYQIHPTTEYAGQCHAFDRLNEILIAAGLSTAPSMPYLPITEQATKHVTDWLIHNNLQDNKFILCHAGSSSSHKGKRWPYFKQLAQRLSGNYKIIWLGSDDDKGLNASLSNIVGIDASNQFSITELIALGKRAKFAVTNDSAPMHILSCSKKPVFGLFGPTNPVRAHALGQKDNITTASLPLAKNDADFKPQDMASISVDTVINKITSTVFL